MNHVCLKILDNEDYYANGYIVYCQEHEHELNENHHLILFISTSNQSVHAEKLSPFDVDNFKI